MLICWAFFSFKERTCLANLRSNILSISSFLKEAAEKNNRNFFIIPLLYYICPFNWLKISTKKIKLKRKVKCAKWIAKEKTCHVRKKRTRISKLFFRFAYRFLIVPEKDLFRWWNWLEVILNSVLIRVPVRFYLRFVKDSC